MFLTNHFLLAMPDLATDYFGQSLTYICEHDENGALGLIINRPTTTSVSDFVADLGFAADEQLRHHLLLEGGPMAPHQGFVLHTSEGLHSDDYALRVTADISLSTSTDCLSELSRGRFPRHFMVALGYVGWGPGQLEQELERTLWLTTAADPAVLFETPYADKLQVAGASLGIDIRLMARPGTA
ncbi:MAG: YqgE/AlgH family protein [Pseudomonadales bacterium]